MAAKFVIKKASDGQFYFNLKAGNGETILTSERYRAKLAATNGIESVKKNALFDERYERKIDKSGHPRFNLKAGNHEIIGSSESYSSEAARNHGIDTVKKAAPFAKVEDETSPKVLRRYTDIPALIYLLTKKKITFLDPQNWDDKNDSFYIAEYGRAKGLRSVLAICFSQSPETYHHWRVFGGGSSGVCIQFDQTKLLTCLSKNPKIICRQVEYLRLQTIRKGTKQLDVTSLPFVKRWSFQPEQEYRAILECPSLERALDVDLPLNCIDRIIFNPWLTPTLFDTLRETVLSIRECSGLQIDRTSLIDSEEWKQFGRECVERYRTDTKSSDRDDDL